jgi:hypothetical protein
MLRCCDVQNILLISQCCCFKLSSAAVYRALHCSHANASIRPIEDCSMPLFGKRKATHLCWTYYECCRAAQPHMAAKQRQMSCLKAAHQMNESLMQSHHMLYSFLWQQHWEVFSLDMIRYATAFLIWYQSLHTVECHASAFV